MLLKLAVFARLSRATLADIERHVSVVRRLCESLFVQDIDIAAGEDTLEVCTLVPTTPPYISLEPGPVVVSRRVNIQSAFICSRT